MSVCAWGGWVIVPEDDNRMGMLMMIRKLSVYSISTVYSTFVTLATLCGHFRMEKSSPDWTVVD